MFKNARLILLVFISLGILSCDKDPVNTIIPFDNEGQISIDQVAIDEYLANHYYNSDDGVFWTIGAGSVETGALPTEAQTPLNVDENLETIEGIEANGTISSYKMYYYEIEEGEDTGNSGYSSPSPVDSVFVQYEGMLLDSTVFDAQERYSVWLQLSNTIEGWRRGLTKFKRGTFTSDGVDTSYMKPGIGYLIFPSGLGYRNQGATGVPANSSLIFKITLENVNLIDTDGDDVPTKFEVSFDTGLNLSFYDTDGDGRSDFEDVDDDNDGKLTKEEVNTEFVTLDNPLDDRGNINFKYVSDDSSVIAREDGMAGDPNYKVK